MASFPWNTPTSRTTGISAESVGSAAGFVGSAIDNATNLDDTLDLQVTINCASAPVANTVMYVYLLFAIDGTNYEDGSTSLQPVKVPVAAIPARAVTGAQVVSVAGIPIPPQPFKIAVWNALGQTSTTTVIAGTYRKGYAS